MAFTLFNKERWIYLALFVLSFAFYASHYHHLMLHLNDVLYGTEGDSLKNYYTYAYHVCNDANAFNFSGMNYPFGEHVVYTDCQPLLTWILRLLPFAGPYAIGILHGLILLSFIITPLILFRIFRLLQVQPLLAACAALAIAFLSPQIYRVGGHFALAYGCVIPLGILLLLQYFKTPRRNRFIALFIYSSCLFFIHPYFGLGVSLFSLLSILFYVLLNSSKRPLLKAALPALIIGVGPIILFKLFMALTDHHTGRPAEPYGVDLMLNAANVRTVFTPFFGPFDGLLKKIFKAEHVEWECLCYVGFFPIALTALAIVTLPFYFRKVQIKKEAMALFITGLVFILIAFGLHIKLLNLLHLNIATLNQFRAFGRFAWYFYFTLPIFLVCLLNALFMQVSKEQLKKALPVIAGLLFLGLNLIEGNALLKQVSEGAFEGRNLFNKNLLTNDERQVLATLNEKPVQAILPLPLFHLGSEVYQRNGDESLKSAMLYSFHARLSILSVMMSRTSLWETETTLELLNPYKNKRAIDSLLNSQPILIIKSSDALKEDELLALKGRQPFYTYDNASFFMAEPASFRLSQAQKDAYVSIGLHGDEAKHVIYIASARRQPFTNTRIDEFGKMVRLIPYTLPGGDYVLSFHYHLKGKKFRYIHNNFIAEKRSGTETSWEYFTSIRSASGFYKDYIVFEYRLHLDPQFGYRFMLNGPMKEYYYISDFMLRPVGLDVKVKRGGETLYNNYPAN